MENIFLPNQRMLVLQGLFKDPGYQLNTEMIQRLLISFGHSCGLADVNSLVGHLERRGYVTTDRLGSGVVIVRLTRAGQDVAEGNVQADGIERPPVED